MPLYASLLLICLTLAAGSLISNRSEIIPERSRFVTFPMIIGEWHGHSSLLETWVENGLALDDYVLSDYSKSDGKAVNLYVAYYASQRTGESPHSPLVCIPGGGWSITRLERMDADTAHPFNRADHRAKWLKTARLLLVRGTRQKHRERILVEVVSAFGRCHQEQIRWRAHSPDNSSRSGEQESDADNRLQLFMQDLRPRLQEYLPPEVATNSPGRMSG